MLRPNPRLQASPFSFDGIGGDDPSACPNEGMNDDANEVHALSIKGKRVIGSRKWNVFRRRVSYVCQLN